MKDFSYSLLTKKILSFVLAIVLFGCNPAFAQTTHFSLAQPSIGNTTTWGIQTNSNWATVDTSLWNASGGLTVSVNSQSSASNITLSNPLASVQNITFTTSGKSLILSAMNATASMIPGGILQINNAGANAFAIMAQDGSTSIISSLPVGFTAYVTLLTNSTANGTFKFNVSATNLAGGGFFSNLAVVSGYSALTPPTNGAVIQGNVAIGTSTAGSQLTVGSTGQFTVDSSGNLSTSGTANLSALTASELVLTDGSKNLVSATSLPSTTTATTQTGSDNSTKVATTAQVQAAITASGTLKASNNLSDLASINTSLNNLGFSGSGGSGHITLAGGLTGGGIILQWATGSSSGALGGTGNASQTINLPTAFPNSILAVVAGISNNGSPALINAAIQSCSLSSCVVNVTNPSSIGPYAGTPTIIAIGN